MKKLLSIVAIVVFFAAIAMPVSAITDDKPTKKAKTENQAEAKKEATKDCAAACGEKKAAACGEKKAACDGEVAPAPACAGKEKK